MLQSQLVTHLRFMTEETSYPSKKIVKRQKYISVLKKYLTETLMHSMKPPEFEVCIKTNLFF